MLVYFSKINNSVAEILLFKNCFNSGKVRSSWFVNNTWYLLLSLINCSLALHSDFNVKMLYNKSEFGLYGTDIR